MSLEASATSTATPVSLRDSELPERHKRRLGNDDHVAPFPKRRNLEEEVRLPKSHLIVELKLMREQSPENLHLIHEDQPRNTTGQFSSTAPERPASDVESYGAPESRDSQPKSPSSLLCASRINHVGRHSDRSVAGEPGRDDSNMSRENDEAVRISSPQTAGTALSNALERGSMAQSLPAAAHTCALQDSARPATRSQETSMDGTFNQQHKATGTGRLLRTDNMDDELGQPFSVRAARFSAREQEPSSSSGKVSAVPAAGGPATIIASGRINDASCGTTASAHPSGQQLPRSPSHAATSSSRNGASTALSARPINPPGTGSAASDQQSALGVQEARSQEEKRQIANPITAATQSVSGAPDGRQLVSDALLFKDITMFLRIQRESVPEPENMNAVDLGDVTSRDGFWNAIHEELESELAPGEEMFKAVIKRTGGLPVENIITDFRMTKSSGRNRSWEDMLKGLHDLYVNERRTVEWALEAMVYVKRKVDAKPLEGKAGS